MVHRTILMQSWGAEKWRMSANKGDNGRLREIPNYPKLQ
jgi:hypothetical protein